VDLRILPERQQHAGLLCAACGRPDAVAVVIWATETAVHPWCLAEAGERLRPPVREAVTAAA
jgi:hypothetical protein